MVVGPHPDSDELRVLAGQKNNLSLPPRSLAYGIETAQNGAAHISYRGFSEATAAQLLRVPDDEEKSALAEAKEFLISELARTPVSARAIKKNAREAEISERTLRRAKQVLGVRSEKESDGSWTWGLPDKESDEGQAATVGNVGPLGNVANSEPDDSAYLREGVQDGQEVQAGKERRCKHDLRDGVGCYLCDPRHPYRLEKGGAL
jgi:putative DNA primase/helicase